MIPEPLLLLVLYTTAAGLLALLARGLKRPIPKAESILFLALPLLFIGPFLPAGRTPVPVDHAMAIPPWTRLPHPPIHNPALNDIALQFAPWAKAVRMAWKDGAIPLRDRWNGCGTPLAANGSSAALFPLTILLFALPLGRAFVLLGALKLLLALSGMWLWLRELGVSRVAAGFGAMTFSLSFAMTPWLYHPATAVICLWPWAFFAIEALCDKGISARAFLLLTGVLSLWPLAGHGEAVAIGALFGAFWLGSRAIARDIPASVLGKTALAAVLALGLTAFATLPQIHAIAASNRLAIATGENRWDFVPWVPYRPGWLGGFVTSLFPLAYGDFIASPMIPGAAGSIVEMGFGYFGLAGWTLALSFLRPGARRGPRGWILVALAAYGLGAAMGLPPFRFLTERIPGIGLMPPLRLLLLVSLAGTVLASFEIDRLREDLKRRRSSAAFPAMIAGVLLLAAELVFLHFREAYAAVGGLAAQRNALLWSVGALSLIFLGCVCLLIARSDRQSRWCFLFLTAVSAVELLHQGVRLYRPGSLALLYPDTPLLRFLRSGPAPYRVAGVGSALLPNSNVFAGVEDIRTHDPTERRDYVEFLDATCGYSPPDYFKVLERFDSAALDFLNVRYLVSAESTPDLPAKWKTVYSAADGWVYENRDVLPRVFAPQRIEFVPQKASPGRGPVRHALKEFGSGLEELLSKGAFRERAVVLEFPGGMELATKTSISNEGRPIHANGRLAVAALRESVNHVSFVATVAERTVVAVASYVQDGGWTAEANGKRLPVALANGPFLAIGLPVGTYRVELSYSPPGFALGRTVALATLAGWAVAFAIVQRRRAFTAP